MHKIRKSQNQQKWENENSEKCVNHEKGSKKGGYVTLGGKCHFMRFPSHLVGAFLSNRMDPRLLRFRPKNRVLDFLTIFDTFLMIFEFYILSLFGFSDFLILTLFDDFWFLSFSHFLSFDEFWSIFVNFCCCDEFLIIFVSKLCA